MLFAQMCNEARGEYLWGPQSCLELLLFSFIYPTCLSPQNIPDASRGNRELEKFWLDLKIAFEHLRKSQIPNSVLEQKHRKGSPGWESWLCHLPARGAQFAIVDLVISLRVPTVCQLCARPWRKTGVRKSHGPCLHGVCS